MQILNKEDILDVIYGTTFLGGGGGGTLNLALRMLKELESHREIRLQMIEVEEMESGKYACMVAGFGSPVSLEKNGFGPDAIYAFRGYQNEYKKEGKDLAYTYSGEYGGLSTFVSMYVAIECDIPFVNLDGNGRAVPEINTTLLPIYGYHTTPVVLANAQGDVIVGTPKDPHDTAAGEKIARQMCMAYGMKVGFACWAVDKENALDKMVPGAIHKAITVGRALRQAMADHADPVKAIAAEVECREIGRGNVLKTEVVTKEGFDFGVTQIQTHQGLLSISFKNENMYVQDGNGQVLLTVPESICMVEIDTCLPLTNAAVQEGMQVAVVALPAASLWWKIPAGFDCWKHILSAMGYTGGPVRY